MRRKSHLIVRITPEHLQGAVVDFVDLCGSDLAAQSDMATNSREQERDRKFATESFNDLSKLLVSKATHAVTSGMTGSIQPQGVHHQTQSNSTSLLSSLINIDGQMVFCVNVNADTVTKQLRHNLTALKFSQKIRDAIIKRVMKRTS